MLARAAMRTTVLVGLTLLACTSATLPAYAQGVPVPALSVGVSAMASAGEPFPGSSLGAVATLRVATAATFELRLAASAYAPLRYSGDRVCAAAPGGSANCDISSQHASQLGIIQIEMATRRPGAYAGFYGVIGAGVYLANEAIKTNPPPGISSRASAFAASAGIGQQLTIWGVRGHAEGRVHRLQAVFGEPQWALSLALASN